MPKKQVRQITTTTDAFEFPVVVGNRVVYYDGSVPVLRKGTVVRIREVRGDWLVEHRLKVAPDGTNGYLADVLNKNSMVLG